MTDANVPPRISIDVLESDRFLDGVLDELAERANEGVGYGRVDSLARWDLKAAILLALRREFS